MPWKKLTILVVDSDAVHRESIRHVLRSAGYRVLEAADYRGAENAHQQHLGQISLVLTALALPGGNGHDLAQSLLAVEPGIKILFVSGETGAKITQFHTQTAQDTPMLRRPFAPRELLQRVNDALEPPRSSLALA